MKKIFLLTLLLCLTSCFGVRLPSDFEYTLRNRADINEEMLHKLREIPPELRESELRKMIETDIKDFRNAAKTVEEGR